MSNIITTKLVSCESLARSQRIAVGSETLGFPQIRCIDDIITNFFNQIVQYVIEDMIVLEPNEAKPLDRPISSQESVTKDYKDLESKDLAETEITKTHGSKVTLTRKSAIKSLSSVGKLDQKSRSSSRWVAKHLEVITEEQAQDSSKTSTSVSSSLQDPLMEEEREVRIIFCSGNVYEGKISKRIMNGMGAYYWTDGTVYEGDFKNGFPTGKGVMTLPDLSRFEGEFNEGLFHGHGFMNIVSTPTFYSGDWKNGMKHGQGWLLYEPGDWYEGSWANDLKDGFGLRYYKNGAKYRGLWREGKCDGDGVMIWETSDYYKGGWRKGAMHGQGEYIWRAFYNPTFAFPLETLYRGAWENGKRHGKGVMLFGDESGIKLKGFWDQDFKHGDGSLICGNGRQITQELLFSSDKPIESRFSASSNMPYVHIRDVPIFTAPEFVNVGYYVDQILDKLQEVSQEKLKLAKISEEKYIKTTIVRFLPQLRALYQDYAKVATKVQLEFEPVMIRLFLWQFYQDIEIYKRGVSIARTDEILAEHPYSGLETTHDPFEPIYFYQFLMSLIGVALTTAALDDIYENPSERGVSAFVIKKFLEDIISAKPDHSSGFLSSHLDLAPIKCVYLLYQKLGQPHSVRWFLRHCCVRKGQIPLMCQFELEKNPFPTSFGHNFVPLADFVTFRFEKQVEMDDWLKHNFTNLLDLRHLGPRNVLRCLSKTCPLIVSDSLIANIDYPLTFLEFYETLVACIFLMLELDMKKEQKMWQSVPTPATTDSLKSKPTSAKKTISNKRVPKGAKKSGKKKKRV